MFHKTFSVEMIEYSLITIFRRAIELLNVKQNKFKYAMFCNKFSKENTKIKHKPIRYLFNFYTFKNYILRKKKVKELNKKKNKFNMSTKIFLSNNKEILQDLISTKSNTAKQLLWDHQVGVIKNKL